MTDTTAAVFFIRVVSIAGVGLFTYLVLIDGLSQQLFWLLMAWILIVMFYMYTTAIYPSLRILTFWAQG